MSFDISCINKIKLEECEDFENSIFSKVYDKAFSMISAIIDENESGKQAGEAMKYAEKNNICNIIAFIGKRGMGKSSAMLSFAYSLKDNSNSNFNSKRFYLLPKIDMSMVTRNESLLDMILAYMWSEYEGKNLREKSSSSIGTDLRKMFIDVKDSYVRFKKMEIQKFDDELYSVKELKTLAKSLQLREAFFNLVNKFLEQMINDGNIARDDKYLVFVIDDLDLVSNNPGEVLEQIKNFLSIPNVIVLTTLDIERGILNKKFELNKQFATENKLINGIDKVLEYATDYMGKVIPFNRRIYMPDIHEKTDEHKIDLEQYGEAIGWTKNKKYPNKIDYEQFCNLLLYKCTGILTDPKMGCLFGESESLREIVNGLNELYSAIDDKNNNEKIANAWIKKETMVLAEKIDSDNLYNFYINNSQYPWYRFADFMVQSIYYFAKEQRYIYDYELKGLIINFEGKLNNIVYSDMLAILVEIRRKLYINDWNKIKNTLWVYSVSYQESKIDSIFSKCIGEATNNAIEYMVYLPDAFKAEISDIRKGVGELLEADYENLTDLIKCAMFTDVEYLISRKLQVKKSEGQNEMTKEANISPLNDNDHLDIGIENLTIKISFDSFINNICNYEDKYEKVINWLYEAIEYEKDKKASILHEKLKMKELKDWHDKYEINSINDFFPVKSLGYMVGLAERLDSNLRKAHTESFSVMYRIVRETVTDYMKECEKYYFIDNGKGKKSDAWNEMLEIVDIENINELKLKALVNIVPQETNTYSKTTR